ncbi:heme o synthase [Thiotrichales bacterium 19S9-12]|nr:heme o synthase [Thiotrichales bacterium 19S9-11]MCF6811798.1 heme o synthase [Thiotrichales bacterium 19S9-12]
MKKFLTLAKPGIIMGNVITVTGGYFLGAQGDFYLFILLSTLIGMALVMGSGCVLNNHIDRDIDRLMERTKNRPTAKNLISRPFAITYGIILGILGLVLLYFQANPLTMLIALIGLVFYVGFYTLWLKRASIYGTIIGGIAGAIPPVVGFTAATNELNLGALSVFLILFLWQIPHSFAIAIYRLDDYKNAKIPVLPVIRGISYTKTNMLVYILAFTFAAIMPSILGYTGIIYFLGALILSGWWFILGLKGIKSSDNDRLWARKMFLFSIIVITLLSVMMVFSGF